MTGLLVFLLCILLLLGGYRLYAPFAERLYGADMAEAMPCDTKSDGVDYVRLPTWRVFLIQLLNIAGLGPVFGALAGCLFGPISLIWIVLGCIFAGGMHDFLAAIMSAERGGENLPETVGRMLGRTARLGMLITCVLLLLLVGAVFTKGPADMLHAHAGSIPAHWWAAGILLYYVLATVLPVHVIISRLYPFFGALFLFMAVGMVAMLPFGEAKLLPNLDACTNVHPLSESINIWPMLFVTSCCGAISGFHATQSPMMVRCLGERRHMRRVFYGAMVAEGIIALTWATVGLTLRDVLTEYALPPGGSAPQLAQGLAGEIPLSFAELLLRNPAAAVNVACHTYLGPLGASIAIFGVVVLPITTGDTAMRTCRLILAETFHLEQKSHSKRLALALPIFAAVILLLRIDFSIIWRYCGWATQCLACFTLWSLAVHLRRRRRLHWIATLPALFMTTMCTAYILHAPEGMQLPQATGSAIGAAVAAACLLLFICRTHPAPQREPNQAAPEQPSIPPSH